MTRWGFCAVLLAGSISQADADATLHVRAFADGAAVDDAEVCIFKGRNGDSLFDRLLADPDVHCRPVSQITTLPTGIWNYYVQSRNRVSSHPFAAIIEERATNALPPIRVDLRLAGWLDLRDVRASLHPGETLAVYVSNDGEQKSPPTARPIPGGVERVAVPADMSLLLLVLGEGGIVSAGRPFRIGRGATIRMPPLRRPSSDLLTVIELDRTVTPGERQAMEGVPAPTLTLTAHGKVIRSAASFRTAPRFDPGIAIFEDVPAGEYLVEVSGEHWLHDQVALRINDERATIAQSSRPLFTRPRAGIEVHWRIGRTALRAMSSTTCDPASSPAVSTLTIYHCAFSFAVSSTRDCPLLKTIPLRQSAEGTERLDDLEPGDYLIDLSRGGSVARSIVTSRLGRTQATDVVLDPNAITGRITRGGESIRAVVRFPGGAAVSDAGTGEYAAWIESDPGEESVRVQPCDGGHEFIERPLNELHANDRYDIDIPKNRLTITVVDSASGDPLETTHLSSHFAGSEVPAGVFGWTNDDGQWSGEALSLAPLEICAHHPAYEGRCVHSEEHGADTRISIELKRSAKRVAHLRSASDVGSGQYYLVRDGSVVGRGAIESGGVLRIAPTTPPDTILYLAAARYPLARLRLPDLTADEPAIELPAPDPIVLSVTLPSAATHKGGPLALEMNGTLVPDEVWAYYQALHGNGGTQIRPGETFSLAPLDRSASLALLLWHWDDELPANLRGRSSSRWSSAPQFVERMPVTGPSVVFGPRR